MHQGPWSCCGKLCPNAHKKNIFDKINLQLEESEPSPGATHARQALQCDCSCSWTGVHRLDQTCPNTSVGHRVQSLTALSLSCPFFPKESLLHPSTVTRPHLPLLFLLASLHLIPLNRPCRSSSVCVANAASKAHQTLPRSAALSDPGRCSHSAPR